jgi:hypothetical protein
MESCNDPIPRKKTRNKKRVNGQRESKVKPASVTDVTEILSVENVDDDNTSVDSNLMERMSNLGQSETE